MKRKAKRQPPRFVPWKALILAIDPGKHCGWATYWAGEYLDSGELSTLDESGVLSVTSTVAMLGKTYGTKPIMVQEFHPWIGSLSAKASLEQSRGIWRLKWGTSGEADSRIKNMGVSTWRGAQGVPVRGDKGIRARIELAKAQCLTGRPVGPDEAAAVLIGSTACHWAELEDVLPKAIIRASA